MQKAEQHRLLCVCVRVQVLVDIWQCVHSCVYIPKKGVACFQENTCFVEHNRGLNICLTTKKSRTWRFFIRIITRQHSIFTLTHTFSWPYCTLRHVVAFRTYTATPNLIWSYIQSLWSSNHIIILHPTSFCQLMKRRDPCVDWWNLLHNLSVLNH